MTITQAGNLDPKVKEHKHNWERFDEVCFSLRSEYHHIQNAKFK